jgi:hypothetical protein
MIKKLGLLAGTMALVSSLWASTPAGMVITVQPARHGAAVPPKLQVGDLTVTEGGATVPVTGLRRLAGDLADMQLFIYLDDSTRSASLGVQFGQLKDFVKALPASTQVAIGYMHNGTFALAQAFTADHQAAARSLRLPIAVPGENGSPYFALSDLAKHWPSKEATGRRAVLMLTDGVDRYWEDNSEVEDPYVDAAIRDTLQHSIAVYSIYLRGAGLYGRGAWTTNFAQSRLEQVSDQTGGFAYFEDFQDPVEIAPFLNDFQDRMDHQYRVTFQALNRRGKQTVKLRTELPGVKIEAPSRIFVP